MSGVNQGKAGSVRIGFIGCGRHSTASLYPNFAKIPQLELVATCDLIPELAKRNARLFGALRHYTDYGRMFEEEELDAAFVVGPPAMHVEIGKACLEAGLHLFVEKPPAMTPEAAMELVEAARRKGRVTQVGHMMRHAPTIRKAIEIVRSDDFGNPMFLESKYFTPGPGIKEGESPRGWGYMIDQATHPIDLAHHFLGKISRLSAFCCIGSNRMPAYSVAVEFESGATGFINLNGAAPHWTSRLEVVGDKLSQVTVTDLGRLTHERQVDGGYLFPVGRPSQTWEVPLRDNSERRAGYLEEMAHFAESILNGRTPYPSIEDGRRALVVCRAILESVRSKSVVQVDYG